MSWRSQLWSFLNSKLGLLLVGFCITTIAGGLFANWIQRTTCERQIAIEQARQDYEWERSMRFELLRAKLKEGQESLEEISDLINLRVFRLGRVFDALTSANVAATEKTWAEYLPTVEKWNTKLVLYQNKIERLVNREFASEFNNYETDNPELRQPKSLHGHFYLTHKKVRANIECMKRGCIVTREMRDDAAESLRLLDLASDKFVDQVSQVFLVKTFDIEQFRASANAQSVGTR